MCNSIEADNRTVWLQWNPQEGTFDCPCHGSHFDRFGQVINGPARANLEEVTLTTIGVKRKA